VKYLIALLICLFFLKSSKSQTLEGTIEDGDQSSLPYVHVINLTNGLGSVSGANGFFIVQADAGDTIRFSFTGFKSLFIAVSDSMLTQDITVTLVPDELVLQSVWVFSTLDYKVPRQLVRKPIKIPGIAGPSKRPTKSVQVGAGINEFGAPVIGIRGALSYFTKENAEKRMAKLAYIRTAQTIRFSEFMALENTRIRFKSTFNLTDTELDHLIKKMNKDQPYIQRLSHRDMILSHVTVYLSSKLL
jgi:hypothetical protein